LATLLLNHAVANVDTAILHRVEVQVEIGAGPHFTTHFERAGGASLGEVLNAIERIVAAADGPIVSQTEHFAEGGAVSDVGSEETTLARQLLERFVIDREIEN